MVAPEPERELRRRRKFGEAFQRAYSAHRAKRLGKTVPAHAFTDLREPALAIGNIVRLNSGGGPLMMVVDDYLLDPETGEWRMGEITVAYRSRDKDKPVVREWDLPRAAVHRVRDAW